MHVRVLVFMFRYIVIPASQQIISQRTFVFLELMHFTNDDLL